MTNNTSEKIVKKMPVIRGDMVVATDGRQQHVRPARLDRVSPEAFVDTPKLFPDRTGGFQN